MSENKVSSTDRAALITTLGGIICAIIGGVFTFIVQTSKLESVVDELRDTKVRLRDAEDQLASNRPENADSQNRMPNSGSLNPERSSQPMPPKTVTSNTSTPNEREQLLSQNRDLQPVSAENKEAEEPITDRRKEEASIVKPVIFKPQPIEVPFDPSKTVRIDNMNRVAVTKVYDGYVYVYINDFYRTMNVGQGHEITSDKGEKLQLIYDETRGKTCFFTLALANK